MRRFINIIVNTLVPKPLFEMANLRPADTGLPLTVFVSERGGARHDVRIKVGLTVNYDPRNTVTVAIRPTARVIGKSSLTSTELAQIIEWIDLNRSTIEAYWDGDLSTREMLDLIVAI